MHLISVRDVPPPLQVRDPITLQIFTDPVVLPGDGETYERAALQEWLKVHGTSPITGEKVAWEGVDFPPNIAMKQKVIPHSLCCTPVLLLNIIAR